MAQREPTLEQVLETTPSRQLFAILAAHKLSINTSRPKPELVAQLDHHLTQPATLMVILTQLDAVAKDALRALLDAEGTLPVGPFENRFGGIRPYRPWRKDELAGDLQPWLAPISSTEQLWYLGLLYRDPPKPKPGRSQHYIIPADLAPLLTAHLAQPTHTTPTTALPYPGRHGALEHHLAIWLATLHADAIRPVHKRWLPPSVVATLCNRLGLDQEPNFTPIRSERHHPYLAFLHYLALAADLVTVTPTAFQLTPTAWAWLNATTATRQQQIYQAWRHAPAELALAFNLPWEPVPPQARIDLTAHLATLAHQPPCLLSNQIAQWRLHDRFQQLPAPRPLTWHADTDDHDPLVALCTGPLYWLGLLQPAAAHPSAIDNAPGLVDDPPIIIHLTAQGAWLLDLPNAAVPAFPPPAPCLMPKQPINTVHIPPHAQPTHLVHLARFCAWSAAVPSPSVHTFLLDAARIAHLAAGGMRPEQLYDQLHAALGRAPSHRTRQRLRTWARQGQQLRLRPLLVLEADSPDLLAQLRRHKLIRNRLGEVIAPNRITLNPTDAAALAQTLRTLNYFVELPANIDAPFQHPAQADGVSPALQWFLITLYNGLGIHLSLAIDLPWDVREALRAQLTFQQQAAAEAGAHQLLDQLQAALNGYLRLPALHMPSTTDPGPLLRAAITSGHDVELRYWGPATQPNGDGQVSTRRVTPYWIEERHQILYLIGWCHLRQQERVFRLDRIEAVVSL